VILTDGVGPLQFWRC